MNFRTALAKFSQGINWNGLFYALYKILFTALSFLLFKYLTTQDFSTWANINSIIFLILLWIDFGLRKSIPRYMPEFAKDKNAHKRFINYILIFQAMVLTITTPIFIVASSGIIKAFQLQNHLIFFYIAGCIFFIEGIVSLLRLIYHAHFWIRQFNSIATVALLAEMIANMLILYTQHESLTILKGIFVTKMCSGLFITTISICFLKRLYKDRNYPGNETINFWQTFKNFMIHSIIMWVNNNLKSLSERNFLVPFFTYTIGQTYANLFKVANDGALFFYRIVLKTIGTTDTALLSHVEALPDRKKLMPIAFKKLTSKIVALCLPLLGILAILFIKGELFLTHPFVFQTFFIMTIGYLLELFISPYERVLEIKRRYGLLTCAYAPYIVMIIILICSNLISSIGLLYSILIIHSVRLVSSFIMFYFARTSYTLLFPLRLTLLLLCIYIPLSLLIYFLLPLYPLTHIYRSLLG